MRSVLRRAALTTVLILAGCGGGASTSGPSRVIRSYGDALVSGDAEASWRLLDEDARRGRTVEEHAALVEQNGEELREQGRSLSRAAGSDAVSAHARVVLGSGETVLLVLEEDGWRIDGGVMDAAGLATPLDAVAALRRALMRRDLRGVERVLSRQTRAEWEEEVRRVVESTEDGDDLEVENPGQPRPACAPRGAAPSSSSASRASGAWSTSSDAEPGRRAARRSDREWVRRVSADR